MVAKAEAAAVAAAKIPTAKFCIGMKSFLAGLIIHGPSRPDIVDEAVFETSVAAMPARRIAGTCHGDNLIIQRMLRRIGVYA